MWSSRVSSEERIGHEEAEEFPADGTDRDGTPCTTKHEELRMEQNILCLQTGDAFSGSRRASPRHENISTRRRESQNWCSVNKIITGKNVMRDETWKKPMHISFTARIP